MQTNNSYNSTRDFLLAPRRIYWLEIFLWLEYVIWSIWLFTGLIRFDSDSIYRIMSVLASENAWAWGTVVFGCPWPASLLFRSWRVRRCAWVLSVFWQCFIATLLMFSGAWSIAVGYRLLSAIASFICFLSLPDCRRVG